MVLVARETFDLERIASFTLDDYVVDDEFDAFLVSHFDIACIP
jgi:hypothetical protein